MYALKGQRTALGVFLDHTPLNLKFTNSARRLTNELQGSTTKIADELPKWILHSSGDSNLGRHACGQELY